jgi:hypothetical protein
VFVAASLASCGPALIEWDVANGRVVRQTCLGLHESDVTIARAGGKLEVVSAAQSVVLCQVDAASFQVVHRVDLGPGPHATVATDGSVTAVAMDLPHGLTVGGWVVVTVDASGGVLGRTAPLSAPQAQVTVLAGRAFVMLSAIPPAKPRLLELRADASVVKQVSLDGVVPAPPLAVKGTRLIVADGRDIIELSPDLDVVARHPLAFHPAQAGSDSLAVSSDGHVLTSEGAVLSDAFTLERQLGHTEDWVHAALWIGSTPVVIGSGAEVVRSARVRWWDLATP